MPDVVLKVDRSPVQLKLDTSPVLLKALGGRGPQGVPAITGLQFFLGGSPPPGMDLLLRARIRGTVPLDPTQFIAGSEVGATSDYTFELTVNGVLKVSILFPGGQQAGPGSGIFTVAPA